MILLLDNYDSFVFNLEQCLTAHGADVETVRNDAHTVDELLALEPSAVVLSPGPGRPASAGVMAELLARLPGQVPVLGVCLGHQALVEAAGGVLEVDSAPVHGRATPVHHTGRGLFEGLPSPFPAGRYHSLRAERSSLPPELELTAWTEDGAVMGVAHRALPRVGVQFHPESILTSVGPRLIARFLALAGQSVAVTRGGPHGR